MTLFTKNLYTPHFSLNACRTDLRNFAGGMLAAVALSAPLVVPVFADSPVLAPRESLASGALVPASPALEMASLALTPSSHAASATAASATTSHTSNTFTSRFLFPHLSEDLTLMLFNDWLDMQDLIKLDTATTNKELREKVLELYTKVALNVRFIGTNITDAQLERLGEKLPMMTALNLTRCNGISESSLISIAKNASRLQELALTDIKISNECIMVFAKNASRLQELALSGIKISNECIMVFAENCPELKRVILSCDRPCIDEPVIITLIEKCQKLQVLELKNQHITDKTLTALTPLCAQLERVAFHYTNMEQEEALIDFFSNCKQLNFAYINYKSFTEETQKRIRNILQPLFRKNQYRV